MKPTTRRRWILLGTGALGAGVAVWWFAWNDPRAREMRRIRGRLEALARVVSFQPGESVVLKLAYPDRVAEFFADPTALEVSLGERRAHGSLGAGEIREGAAGMRATAKGLKVAVFDVTVELPAEEFARKATAHLTTEMRFVGEADYLVQEFRIELEKESNVWRIRRLATVRTMEP